MQLRWLFGNSGFCGLKTWILISGQSSPEKSKKKHQRIDWPFQGFCAQIPFKHNNKKKQKKVRIDSTQRFPGYQQKWYFHRNGPDKIPEGFHGSGWVLLQNHLNCFTSHVEKVDKSSWSQKFSQQAWKKLKKWLFPIKASTQKIMSGGFLLGNKRDTTTRFRKWFCHWFNDLWPE